MRKTFILTVLGLAALTASLSAQVTITPEGVQQPQPVELQTDRSEYEHALSVYQGGDARSAIALADGVVKTYDSGPWVERAMLLKARAWFHLNDLKQSSEALEALKKKFPATSLGAEISDLQLAIARKQMEKKSTVGTRSLEKMVEENPYGPRSDEAQFEVGENYLKNKQYFDAMDAFSIVLIHYPDSRFREDAMFLRIKAVYLTNWGAQRDPNPFEETRQGVQDYLKEFPEGKYVKEANDLLVKSENALAEKLYLIGEYYRQQKHERASEKYYAAAVTKYPKSSWAKMARTKLPVDWVAPEPKTGAKPPETPAEEKPEATPETKPGETPAETPGAAPTEVKPPEEKPAETLERVPGEAAPAPVMPPSEPSAEGKVETK